MPMRGGLQSQNSTRLRYCHTEGTFRTVSRAAYAATHQ